MSGLIVGLVIIFWLFLGSTKIMDSVRTDKPWGYEVLLECNGAYAVKLLFMKSGCRCSWQFHEVKRETVVVFEGVLRVVLEGEDGVVEEIILERLGCLTILPGVRHRMVALDMDVLYVESSTPELGDVVRLSDDFGRV